MGVIKDTEEAWTITSEDNKTILGFIHKIGDLFESRKISGGYHKGGAHSIVIGTSNTFEEAKSLFNKTI